ncbi:hypothetical protein SASPL_152445 [Salvia splendens]|uniref:PB1-like domain-containing protein n=1 Tax=Salvia splendens TaxID=180675 RepID=A0A8X8W3D8_SALSN|nr:hypothetical protein SASPL_152445 [Salvia splendens]
MNVYCLALNMVILPLCRDDFTIQFHHGGDMVKDGALEVYIGRDETYKSHFDADKFDYFDLIDEIKQLVYGKWSRVAFMVPKTVKKIDIKDDKYVMLMLSYLELGICVLHVYVVGGELGEAQVEEVEGSVGGKHADEGVNESEDESEGEDNGSDMENGEDNGPGLEKGEEEGDQ